MFCEFKKKSFSVSDLETGMICLHRNGEYSFVVRDDSGKKLGALIQSVNSWIELEDFSNDTFLWDNNILFKINKKKNRSNHSKGVDIIKVFRASSMFEASQVIYKTAREINTKDWEVVCDVEKNGVLEIDIESLENLFGKKIKIVGVINE